MEIHQLSYYQSLDRTFMFYFTQSLDIMDIIVTKHLLFFIYICYRSDLLFQTTNSADPDLVPALKTRGLSPYFNIILLSSQCFFYEGQLEYFHYQLVFFLAFFYVLGRMDSSGWRISPVGECHWYACTKTKNPTALALFCTCSQVR